MSNVLADLIAQSASVLTEADARLLDVLMQDPVRAAMESGKTMSLRAGVHPASAVRLARRLGFGGYPEFRSYLQSNLIDDDTAELDDPAARIAARLVRAEKGGVLCSILDSEIAALQTLRSALSDEDIRASAEMLRDARRVFIYGLGHAAILSALVSLRLRRSGYDTVDLAMLPNLAEALTGLESSDVVWLMSFRDPRPTVQAIRQIAAERSAKVLLLGDTNSLRITPPAHRAITISRGSVGQSQSLVVPMTVANAIILDLAAIDDARSLLALATFRRFRETLPAAIPR